MTQPFQRYAVYWLPPAHSGLAYAGAAWFGHDPEFGERSATLSVPGLPDPREALVRRPRRYGLHATLKAPFRLADGVSPADLDAAVAALAAGRQPATAPPLRVETDMGFVALKPAGPCPEIDALAAACVTQLDPLRAPLKAEELADRRRAGLDTVEDQHLRSWGYPYVLDRFRFHVTLTGALARSEAEQAADALRAAFAPALAPAFVVAQICVVGDPGDGQPFRLVSRHRLGGR